MDKLTEEFGDAILFAHLRQNNKNSINGLTPLFIYKYKMDGFAGEEWRIC